MFIIIMDNTNIGFSYEINEMSSNCEGPTDLSDILDKMNNVSSNNDDGMEWSTNYLKLQLHYTDNFIVKDLHKICDYYNIDKRKLRKDQLVEEIILFELDTTNLLLVQTRKRLWFYMTELKNDKFFKKYVMWE